jgi:hypothetical protein
MVVIAPWPSKECRGARFVWSNQTAAATDAFMHKHGVVASCGKFFSLTEFDLVLCRR